MASVDTPRPHNVQTLQIFEDGSIVFDWRWTHIAEARARSLCVSWMVALFGNALLGIERLRHGTSQFVDYGMDFHVFVREPLKRVPYTDEWTAMPTGEYAPTDTVLGRYFVSDRASFQSLLEQFETDVDHLAGVDNQGGTIFHIDRQLAAIDATTRGM